MPEFHAIPERQGWEIITDGHRRLCDGTADSVDGNEPNFWRRRRWQLDFVDGLKETHGWKAPLKLLDLGDLGQDLECRLGLREVFEHDGLARRCHEGGQKECIFWSIGQLRKLTDSGECAVASEDGVYGSNAFSSDRDARREAKTDANTDRGRQAAGRNKDGRMGICPLNGC